MAPMTATLLGSKNESVKVEIRQVKIVQDTLAWYTQWYQELFDLAGNRLYEDSHWKVPDLWSAYSKSPDHRVLVIDSEGWIQGYTILKSKNYIGVDGAPCTYIHFLASAPWNRKSRKGSRNLKGTGKLLLGVSALAGLRDSKTLCVELESLPDAEDFYKYLGMRSVGTGKQGLTKFRMDKSDMLAFLRPLLPSIMKGDR